MTDADDSVEDGQFKKLKASEEKIELQINLGKGYLKLPTAVATIHSTAPGEFFGEVE